MSGFTFTATPRVRSWGRVLIEGPPGAGKSHNARLAAEAFAHLGWEGRTAVMAIVTEATGAFPDLPVLTLGEPFSPERFAEAIGAALHAGAGALIIDSLSAEWSGLGGVRDQVDRAARDRTRSEAWQAMSARHARLLDRIHSTPVHIVATVRRLDMDDQFAEQSKGLAYDFGFAVALEASQAARVSKSGLPARPDGPDLARHASERPDSTWWSEIAAEHAVGVETTTKAQRDTFAALWAIGRKQNAKALHDIASRRGVNSDAAAFRWTTSASAEQAQNLIDELESALGLNGVSS